MDAAYPAAIEHLKPADLDLIGASFQEVSECLMLVENGTVIFANPACSSLLHFDDVGPLVGRKLSTLFTPTRFCLDLQDSSEPLHCANPSCQRSLCRADGSQVEVELRCTSFRRNRRSFLLLAIREVRRQELARLLRDNELRFRAIFHEAAIGIGTTTLDGRIIETNPALTKMLGYTADELSGMHASELHPNDFVEDTKLIRELVEGKCDSFQLEKRYRRKDGSTLWGRVTVSMVRDAESQPQFLIAMLEDITARKRAEEQLREAEKMEVIGRLAGGVAHDFNNLLTGILLYCDLLRGGLDPKHRLLQHVEEIRMAGEQGAALTQQLLSIARKHSPVRQPVSLNQVVISTENLLRRLIGEHVELATILGADLAPVLADPAQLRQVIVNLALNARDAMPHGGRITVGTHACVLSNSPAGVELSVEDTGCGMDEITRARLFEPFFTTKKPGHGTGLGLATVQRIVKEIGGRIEVTTELGRGTRIEVQLPAMDTFTTAVAAPDVSAAGQTILLVDDNASARKSMQRILRNAGYHVLSASTGKRALKVFADCSAIVDLLLADWMMPGLSGHELANTVLRKKPDVKVLLISGYQDGAPESDGGSSYALIRKPFAGNVLIEKIHQVLQSKGDSQCS